MEAAMYDELLLVCSALGSTEQVLDEEGVEHSRFLPGEDCLEWLQDLQRALRRDDDATRDVANSVVSLRVVQDKLVPLFIECRDDKTMLKTLTKVFVMLTMAMPQRATDALSRPVSLKADAETRVEHGRRRENAAHQLTALRTCKRALACAPVISGLMGMLVDPLANVGRSRSEEDSFTVELVLTLVRNILAIPDPPATPSAAEMVSKIAGGDAATAAAAEELSSQQSHDDMLLLLRSECMLDTMQLLAQDIASRDNAQLNLLLLDILHCTVGDADPAELVAAARGGKAREGEAAAKGSKPPAEKTSAADSQLRPTLNKPGSAAAKQHPKHASSGAGASGSGLRGRLEMERAMRDRAASALHSRHSRFGCTLKSQSDGRTPAKFLANPFQDPAESLPQAARRAARHRRQPLATLDGASNALGAAYAVGMRHKPQSAAAKVVLHDFCASFLRASYDPFMRSVKTDFRRESSRIQPQDTPAFLRLVEFFLAFHRLEQQAAASEARRAAKAAAEDYALVEMEAPRVETPKYQIGQVLETLDLMTFHLALSECDEAVKKGQRDDARLERAVCSYKEMLRVLAELCKSGDATHRLLALGLLQKLFYSADSLDRLPDVVRNCRHDRQPLPLLRRVAELVHVTLQLLETAAKVPETEAAGRGRRVSAAAAAAAEAGVDKDVAEVARSARDYDVDGYVLRLANNHTLNMYTTLLSHYATNGPKVNHHVVVFFMRLSAIEPYGGSSSSSSRRKKKRGADADAAASSATLEPMLYNVRTLAAFRKILEDPRCRASAFQPLVQYAAAVARHFARLAERNPLLFVEALYRHPAPHRFCARVEGGYYDGGAGDFASSDSDGGGGGGAGAKAAELPSGGDKGTPDHPGRSGSGGGGNSGGGGSGSGGGSALFTPAARARGARAGEQSSEDEWDESKARVVAAPITELRKFRRRGPSLGTRRQSASSAREAAGLSPNPSPGVPQDGDAAEESSENEWDDAKARIALSSPPPASANAEAASDAAGEAGGDDDSGGKGSETEKSKPKSKKKMKKDDGKRSGRGGGGSSGGGTKAAKRSRWTAEEDALLRKEYPKYAGVASAFVVLAQEELLEESGRTAEQIARRVKHLGLANNNEGGAAVEDGGGDDSDAAAASAANGAQGSEDAPMPDVDSGGKVSKETEAGGGSGGVSQSASQPATKRRLQRGGRPSVGSSGGGNSSSDESIMQVDGASDGGVVAAAAPVRKPPAKRQVVLDSDSE